MATTQISDVFVREVYETYGTVNSPELTAFWESGVIVENPILSAAFDQGGQTLTVPFWKDLDSGVEPNYSSDDPSQIAGTQKIATGTQVARKSMMNQAWSVMDLTAELAGKDPMQAIKKRTDTYWARQWQRRVLASCVGLLNDNVAANSGDMVINRAINDGNNATDANLFGRTAFTSAAFTLGDAFKDIRAIGVHSMVAKRMIDNDDIVYIPDSQGQLTIPTYLGRRVIIDDGMPVAAGGTSGFKYTSVLFGAGALAYGNGKPKVSSEVWRNPKAGNGGGQEELIERKSWIIHPFGYKWTDPDGVGDSATLAELSAAVSWERQIERKNVPLAFLVTNG